MEFITADIRGIDDPAELRRVIAAAGRQPKSERQSLWESQMQRRTNASALAHRYAPHNQGLRPDSGNLLRDPWVNALVDDLTDPDRAYLAVDALLSLTEIYVVPDQPQIYLGRQSTGKHLAYHTPSNGGPLRDTHRGECGRCSTNEWAITGTVEKRELQPVHVARRGLIAEFYLCKDCLDALHLITGAPAMIASA